MEAMGRPPLVGQSVPQAASYFQLNVQVKSFGWLDDKGVKRQVGHRPFDDGDHNEMEDELDAVPSDQST
jgi:hypothetical protein